MTWWPEASQTIDRMVYLFLTTQWYLPECIGNVLIVAKLISVEHGVIVEGRGAVNLTQQTLLDSYCKYCTFLHGCIFLEEKKLWKISKELIWNKTSPTILYWNKSNHEILTKTREWNKNINPWPWLSCQMESHSSIYTEPGQCSEHTRSNNIYLLNGSLPFHFLGQISQVLLYISWRDSRHFRHTQYREIDYCINHDWRGKL